MPQQIGCMAATHRVAPSGRLFAHLAATILACCSFALARGDEPGATRYLSRFFAHDLSIITVTDFTPEGAKLVPPTRAHPVYYEALILGYNDWGRTVAGEKIPDKNKMVRLIMKVLADQGYYPCTPQHPATQVLAMAWGSMNRKGSMSLLFMGGDKLDVLWELNPYIGNLLDPRVLTRGMRSGTAETVLELAGDNLYVASVQAFDAAAAYRYETVKLWHTKITCPAAGAEMDVALRQMIRTAGPHFGRETALPVMVSVPPRNPVVELGELKVLETIDLTKLPVTDRTVTPRETQPAH
jgi:hypothetical protein